MSWQKRMPTIRKLKRLKRMLPEGECHPVLLTVGKHKPLYFVVIGNGLLSDIFVAAFRDEEDARNMQQAIKVALEIV